MESENSTAYFLVHDPNLGKISEGGDPFYNWLVSEGFTTNETYHDIWDFVPGIWININTKIMAVGTPGIKCYEQIGHHAITIDELKIIYAIYKKYEGKPSFVFDWGESMMPESSGLLFTQNADDSVKIEVIYYDWDVKDCDYDQWYDIDKENADKLCNELNKTHNGSFKEMLIAEFGKAFDIWKFERFCREHSITYKEMNWINLG